ncbi:isoprenylcysteine carboxylmethyltransferase family protein [Actibacterium pelagium]|uniref:Membrane protein n=1 Tax=Actibacterium pelagium TaxID=2029103 RepID=A0A917EME1_9RHOB|nr:isoprenylcysteine carboxylmethyltransferase family protein [Actibacterium pelagium]GGE61103.1 membrane protein [Actibacterium pelagium]
MFKSPTEDRRPTSDVRNWTGLIGLVGFVIALFLLRMGEVTGTVGPLIMLASAAIPMVLWDVLVEKVHRAPTAGFDFGAPTPWDEALSLAGVKLVGLLATFALIGAAYFVLRTYSDAKFDYYYVVLGSVGQGLLLMSPFYILLTTRFMSQPRDSLWQFGNLVLGRWGQVEWPEISNYLLSWAVKGFFLSFMFSVILPMYQNVILFDFSELANDPKVLVFFAIPLLFLVDVCFGTVGYIFSLRILDSHIRTANPYLAGWVAALICYPPFALMASGQILDYRANTVEWWQWFQGYPLLLAFWGLCLVILTVIYAWATVIFGLRFSNLTNRGIITAGPYSLFKHPAYLSKCVFWWMLYVPFLSLNGPAEAIRSCVLLTAVCAIYYWRAKTEERHLMEEPKYQAYSEWIAQHGLLQRIRQAALKL